MREYKENKNHIEHKKIIKMRKIFKKVAFISACLAFFSVVNATNTIRVIVNDTIAGYPTTLKTSTTKPNQKITFKVKKPNNSVVEIYAETDDLGVAKTDLLGFHTKITGTYQVSATFFGENHDNTLKSIFEVFPGELSASQSRVTINPGAIPADGIEKALIKISLKDEYSNAIANHNVIIVSSRVTDNIEKVSDSLSDQNGNIFYEVSSTITGISHFTAIDRINGSSLNDREKLVFFEPDYSPNIGGNYLKANLFGDDDIDANLFNENLEEDRLFGPIDHFEIDFPSKISIGSDQAFLKISAKDKQGRIVKNYTGTVIISTPNDEYATLPDNGKYTFTESDQGERTFSLALIFSKTGRQTIEVFDFDPETGIISEFIKGEKVVEVVSGDIDPTPQPSDEIEIKKPQDGSKFGGTNVMLVGKARPNTTLFIFLNKVKVDDAEVDSDGIFTKEIKNVGDGSHEIYVREAEGGQEMSKTAKFSIDSLPPTLDEIEISPSGSIYAGNPFTITIKSEPSLQNVTIRAGSINEVLLEDRSQRGKYEIIIPSPSEPGEYPISVTLEDEMQNKSEFTNAAILKVIPKTPTKNLPIPENLQAKALDSSVKLSWDNIEETENVTKIRVLYGTGQFNLTQSADVEINQNEVIIKDLKNDTNYFFSLVSIDSENNQSDQSLVVSAIPQESNLPIPENLQAEALDSSVRLSWDSIKNTKEATKIRVLYGTGQFNLTQSADVEINQNEVIIKDLKNDTNYFFSLVSIDSENNQSNQSLVVSAIPQEIVRPVANEFFTTAGNKQVYLRWTPVENVSYFEIAIGVDDKNFLETIHVLGSTSSATIKDLINGQKYYFKLTPKNASGASLDYKFPIVSTAPTWDGIHPDPNPPITIEDHKPPKKTENGPIHEKIIFSSALFALALFLIRRSLLVFRN